VRDFVVKGIIKNPSVKKSWRGLKTGGQTELRNCAQLRSVARLLSCGVENVCYSFLLAVAENQPVTKHRMNNELSQFAAHLRGLISRGSFPVQQFERLALELFALQFANNRAYATICEARGLTPRAVEHWTQIPSVSTGAFKELELSAIPIENRTAVFHSSGTTEQKPSRHLHCPESLAVYETSLWEGFRHHFRADNEFVFLTPSAVAAPRSSLVHMFETVGRNVRKAEFFGAVGADGGWTIDFNAVTRALSNAAGAGRPITLLGTAFNFVHLLDYLREQSIRFDLPADSCVMETGGYKNRSRTMPKDELHGLITEFLGVPNENIICEYGMSELSSQAYDRSLPTSSSVVRSRVFKFPPWAKVRIISPETGLDAADGDTGLIRMVDLANVFSVAAIQTEDLGRRRADGFEWVGRVQSAESRGCSLMAMGPL
jgi:hypothetical protein